MIQCYHLRFWCQTNHWPFVQDQTAVMRSRPITQMHTKTGRGFINITTFRIRKLKLNQKPCPFLYKQKKASPHIKICIPIFVFHLWGFVKFSTWSKSTSSSSSVFFSSLHQELMPLGPSFLPHPLQANEFFIHGQSLQLAAEQENLSLRRDGYQQDPTLYTTRDN